MLSRKAITGLFFAALALVTLVALSSGKAGLSLPAASEITSRALLAMGPILNTSINFNTAAFLATDTSFLELKRAVMTADTQAVPEARAALAHSYEERRLLASAAAEFRAAADAARDAGQAEQYLTLHVDLGRVLLKSGDLRGARSALEVAAGGFPADRKAAEGYRSADVWVLQANEAKAAGRYQDAQGLLDRAKRWLEQAGDQRGLARAFAAECDLLQLQRFTAQARGVCNRALALQPPGHPDRADTEKTLGLVYYFTQDLARATSFHTAALKGYRSKGSEEDALYLREFVLDDQSAVLEGARAPAEAYRPLIHELTMLTRRLEAAPEVVWWRVSDARLRLADLVRKTLDFPEAGRQLELAIRAFEKRPEGYEDVPDYATLFEFEGLLAKDRGDTAGARAALSKCKALLERIVGQGNLDVQFLTDEISTLEVGIEA